MGIEEKPGSIVIKTTDIHLPRAIGEALHHAYKGSLDGSAEMNIWLHKQVMQKLAENGGKVPEELRK